MTQRSPGLNVNRDKISKVEGFSELIKVLKQLPRQMEHKVLQDAASAGAREAAKHIRAAAPRYKGSRRSPASTRYGPLHKNIRVKALRRWKPKGIRGARVFTGNAFWGTFLEYGTKHIKAKPWFRPAVMRNKDAIVQAIGRGLVKGLDKQITLLEAKNTAQARFRRR